MSDLSSHSLHQSGADVRQFRAFAAVEGDMGGEGLAFEAVARVNEAVAAAVHIRNNP
mgnify:CR=1 FL=1